MRLLTIFSRGSWFDFGRKSGKQEERERIIKLLENEKFILPDGIDEGMTLMPIQEAIARIKGEYK
jgi:hypothetical protein